MFEYSSILWCGSGIYSYQTADVHCQLQKPWISKKVKIDDTGLCIVNLHWCRNRDREPSQSQENNELAEMHWNVWKVWEID